MLPVPPQVVKEIFDERETEDESSQQYTTIRVN
jgi:hypothetical protein